MVVEELKEVARKYLGFNSEKIEKILESSADEGIEEAINRAEIYSYFFIDKESASKMGKEMREIVRAYKIGN
ncbi:hypothetical protein DRP07_01635 [Archaeoglobales archaeon]|nr:MAG: hypothetical protein DRP07_01635 [Archaeoglobales archaeon]